MTLAYITFEHSTYTQNFFSEITLHSLEVEANKLNAGNR